MYAGRAETATDFSLSFVFLSFFLSFFLAQGRKTENMAWVTVD